MSAYFFDSSSLVKRFTAEKGSLWVSNLFRVKSGHSIFCSRITFVEVTAALARKPRNRDLSADRHVRAKRRFARQFAFRIYKLDVAESVIAEAAELTETHGLRGYDAVQLASALEVGRYRLARGLSQIIFVNADVQLSAAAQAEGLVVEDPNNYR